MQLIVQHAFDLRFDLMGASCLGWPVIAAIVIAAVLSRSREGGGVGCQFGKRMVVAYQAYGRGMAYVAYNLDAVARLADAEALSSQNFTVAQGVKFGEARAEFKFVAVDTDGPVSSLFSLHGIFRADSRS